MPNFYIIVIGSDQEVKCQLLNAMARQPELFRQFSCRTSPVVKSVKNLTVSGHMMNLVLTPSIGTAPWVKLETNFKEKEKWKAHQLCFVYIKTDPSTVDDVSAIKAIKDKFGTSSVRTVASYSGKDTSFTDNDKHFKYGFNLDADFQTQVQQSVQILCNCMPAPEETTPSQIGARSDFNPGKTFRKETSKEKEERQSALSSVTVPETGETKKTRDKITPADWLLFQRALKTGTSRTNHVRVNVVGNHGVGKSTLIKRLLMQDVKCPDDCQIPTENLEVHHLIARCVEKNGKKVWENDTDDTFLEDLNVQRMAQAMIETSNIYKPCEPSQLNPPNQPSQASSRAAIQMGSDYIDDAPEQPNSHYSNLVAQQEKKEYLTKVLNSMDQLESENCERQYVSYWDFAGQSTYYATHQLFMSPSAVYLLVTDLRHDLETKVTDNLDFRKSGILQSCTVEGALKYWIQSVQAYTKDELGGHAPIIIVGTHSNDVTADQIEKKFAAIRKLFDEDFVECISLDSSQQGKNAELDKLRGMIIDKCLTVTDKKISSQWINLEYDMQISPIGQKHYLKFSDLQQIDQKMDLPIRDASRLEAFLCHQHFKGKLLFYHYDDLKEFIITDPMLMVKFLNLLLRRTEANERTTKTDRKARSGKNEDGVLDERYIRMVAEKINIDDYAWMLLLKILVKLHILHPLSSEGRDGSTDQYFLPCLLNDVPTHDGTDDDKCTKSSVFELRFSHCSIYQTRFHQLICALMKKMDLIKDDEKKLIYNLQACFDVENDECVWLKLYWKNEKVYFYVKDFKMGKEKAIHEYITGAMKLIEDAMEDVLTTNQHGNVDLSFSVECPCHTGTFLSLERLREKKFVLCKKKGALHQVTTSDLPSVAELQDETKNERPVLREKPSEQILARIAWRLKFKSSGNETCAHLARSLRMSCSFVKADVATRDYNDAGADFLSILIDWRNKNKDRTCSLLLKRLCEGENYDRSTLLEAMLNPPKSDPRIDNVPANAATDNRDIVIISDHLVRGFTFVLIELGLRLSNIENQMRNHMFDTRAMVRSLLGSWRASKPAGTATTRAILEAMRMFDLPLDKIIKELNLDGNDKNHTEDHADD